MPKVEQDLYNLILADLEKIKTAHQVVSDISSNADVFKNSYRGLGLSHDGITTLDSDLVIQGSQDSIMRFKFSSDPYYGTICNTTESSKGGIRLRFVMRNNSTAASISCDSYNEDEVFIDINEVHNLVPVQEFEEGNLFQLSLIYDFSTIRKMFFVKHHLEVFSDYNNYFIVYDTNSIGDVKEYVQEVINLNKFVYTIWGF